MKSYAEQPQSAALPPVDNAAFGHPIPHEVTRETLHEAPSEASSVGASEPQHRISLQPNRLAVEGHQSPEGMQAPLAISPIQPKDLVGCRYRPIQRLKHPQVEATQQSAQRKLRLEHARNEVLALLPHKASLGDKRNFHRVDLDPEDPNIELLTLEAMATQADLITSPVLADIGFSVSLDAIIRRKDGTYMPVLVTNHRVARPDARRTLRVIDTPRLGLGQGYKVNAKLKHHSADSFTLAMAARILAHLGVGCNRGVLIGQNHAQGYVLDTDLLQPGLEKALATPLATQPRRIKECAGCRYQEICRVELERADDLSLFLPGDRANRFREQGIHTVQGLIDAGQGRASQLAAAWRAGVPVLTQVPQVTFPRFDVEIDIDVEAYLDQGAYLWGAFDGTDYHPFVTWSGLGEREEAENFAAFWGWLCAQRDHAKQTGQSIGVFCYSAHGENHWLKFSARRFHGKYPGVPSPKEVAEFIGSGKWIDVYAAVREQCAGPVGLGLKIVAPQAGFQWAEKDIDGEASVALYLEAAGIASKSDDEMLEARAALLSYNGDDCKATAAVRKWLAAGAPGTPALKPAT